VAHEVVVVGAGPTGLFLAGELALAGIDVQVLERRTTGELVGTRARGFHARTIEILDQRGIAERFLEAGQTFAQMSFGDTPLDVEGLPSRHAYTLALGQAGVEELLLGWVEELGVTVRRGVEVTGVEQDDDGVDVQLADGETVPAAYVVAADGGRSAIRRAVGIDMVGPAATRTNLIAEVAVTEEWTPGMRLDELGVHAMGPVPGQPQRVNVVVTEPELGPSTEPTLDELRAAMTAVWGSDLGAHDPTWISRFTDASRQATQLRSGRVLLAGDAAHTHPPTGGQGIGLGVQDAVNLGWKLAQVVRGTSSPDLLDSYHEERHPDTARVLANVVVQAMLQRGDARTTALRETLSSLAGLDEGRTALAALLHGLDVRHGSGEGHPLHGRRVPDLDLVTDDGPTRIHELLHDARWLLLDLGLGLEPIDHVRHVRATTEAAWILPVVGLVEAPGAVLVRPDGHVAWVGTDSDDGLDDALAEWCGGAA
jgi:3-(3-hydroxy-phenyl)propionate hydroxylase